MHSYVASTDADALNVVLVGGSGLSQGFDLLLLASRRAKTLEGSEIAKPEDAVDKIQSLSQGSEQFFWGHPARRWRGFLSESSLDALVTRSNINTLIVHGTEDEQVPVEGAIALFSELVRHGRNTQLELFKTLATTLVCPQARKNV